MGGGQNEMGIEGGEWIGSKREEWRGGRCERLTIPCPVDADDDVMGVNCLAESTI